MATSHVNDYRVKIEAFEGPMDLLLFLIRRAEVEITDIPIASITEQYLGYLKDADLRSGTIDIDRAGEFLVMAATLMEIKSRMLMPRSEGQAGEESGESSSAELTDPRAELVRQLLVYKKYRDAAQRLHQRLDEWESRFPASQAAYDSRRVQEAMGEMADMDIEDLELVDLMSAFARVIESVDMTRVGEHHVVVDDTPIELHAEDILDRLRREAGAKPGGGPEEAAGSEARAGEVAFTTFVANRTRGELIGLFLAMLELVRQRRIGVRQDPESSNVFLRVRNENEEEATGQASARASEDATLH
ncbi:MAG: ScpA family protein [Phycisphaerales bacterium]